MRKRRVIICDTNPDVLSSLSYFFTARSGYDVLIYHEPSFCPIWADHTDCTSPCADILIAGLVMPRMSGITLYRAQSLRGCGVFIKNKALISAATFDNTMKDIVESDSVLFEKPLDFNKIAAWLHHREEHMNLSQPLIIKRREIRFASDRQVEYRVRPNANISKGTSINASSSGLCLKTDTPLRYEQTVTINPAVPNLSEMASVRWTYEMEGGGYLVGLQFL